MKWNTGRKAAQRMVPANACAECGSTEKLERHHIDQNPMNNAPLNVVVLCSTCHHKQHPRLALVACSVCGQIFQPKRSRRAKLCGSLSCSKIHGQRSAELRWAR